MRFTARALIDARRRARPDLDLDGAHDALRRRAVRPLPARADADLPRRPRLPLGRARAAAGGAGAVSEATPRPSGSSRPATAASCRSSTARTSCSRSPARSRSRTSSRRRAPTAKGPYDLTLVEGSITTPHDAERIHEIRRNSKVLVTIGACATSGGIQALRNFANVGDFVSAVYAHPDYISTLRTSTAIADHVPVDFELQGCPINKAQLLEVVGALLAGRRPNVPAYSVCVECKRAGVPCVMVVEGRRVPRSGDARRLRRALPALRARLLRLLRPEGAAEHRVARGATGGRSAPTSAAPARLPRHQRERARLPERGHLP